MITYVLVNQSVSASADYGPVTVTSLSAMYVQVVAGAGVTGTLTIQTSADGISYFNDTVTMTVNGATVDAEEYNISAQYVRFSYAHTGATGQLKIVANVSPIL